MQEIGLLICVWENKYADKTVDFAICVDKTGKRYNIELDNIIFSAILASMYIILLSSRQRTYADIFS